LLVAAGCSTVKPAGFHAKPPEITLQAAEAPTVSVSPQLRDDPTSHFNANGVTFDIDRNAFSTELARLLAESLKNAGVPAGGDREIRVAVVYLDFLFSGPCVLDYNVGLGEQPAFGMQSRGDSSNFATACRRALENAVRDIVADSRTAAFLTAGP